MNDGRLLGSDSPGCNGWRSRRDICECGHDARVSGRDDVLDDWRSLRDAPRYGWPDGRRRDDPRSGDDGGCSGRDGGCSGRDGHLRDDPRFGRDGGRFGRDARRDKGRYERPDQGYF